MQNNKKKPFLKLTSITSLCTARANINGQLTGSLVMVCTLIQNNFMDDRVNSKIWSEPNSLSIFRDIVFIPPLPKAGIVGS